MKQKKSSGKIFLVLNGLARNIRQCFSDVSALAKNIVDVESVLKSSIC